MNIEEYRAYCLGKPGTSEATPFDEVTLVFKVGGKMFALCNIDRFEFVNLKCDPNQALELREAHSAIRPGYHMSKKHWNSVYLHELMDEELILKLIDQSYNLVYQSLTLKLRKEIAESVGK